MPHSFDFFNADVKKFVESLPASGRILDIGPGAGKYGKMFKDSGRVVDAVEVFAPYVDQYKLRDIYGTVHISCVTKFKLTHKQYDLVIMGDILEHLTVPEAQEFLAHLAHCEVPVLVLVPYSFPQLGSHGNDHEEHKQPDLTEALFHQRYPGFRLVVGNGKQGVFFRD